MSRAGCGGDGRHRRRIQGELARLGHTIAKTTVWQILTDNGIDPSPNRSEVTWTEFLHSHAAVASDSPHPGFTMHTYQHLITTSR